MVEQNKGAPAATRDVWKEQEAKAAGKKRKHQKAFGNGGKMDWSKKRDNKRRNKQKEAEGGRDDYEISQYTIGSDRFNEYYKVSEGEREWKGASCRLI